MGKPVKKPAKVALYHFDEENWEFVSLNLPAKATTNHLRRHEFDALDDGTGVPVLPEQPAEEEPVEVPSTEETPPVVEQPQV